MHCKIILIFGFAFILACKPKMPYTENSGFENEYFRLQTTKCLDSLLPGIDGIVGELICNGIKYNYEVAWAPFIGPESLKNSFTNSFNAYFYKKFFDELYFDEKLHKLFLDSVQIIDVYPSINPNTSMFKCDNCNALAELIFKKRMFKFPFQTNRKFIEEYDVYEIKYDTIGDYIKKSFLLKNYIKAPIGISFMPTKNKTPNKNTLSIYSVPESEIQLDRIKETLSTVIIKELD